jgi:hypothetical protein
MFLNSVVAIGQPIAGSDPQWMATGFLYGHLTDSSVDPHLYQVYLVTNSHVASPPRPLVVRFNPVGNGPAQILEVSHVDDDNKIDLWTFHPDIDIDVAVIPVNMGVLAQSGLRHNFFEGDNHVLRVSELQSSGVSPGDGIFLLGFPGSTGVGVRSDVTVRGGCIARLEDIYNGLSKTFLIDSNNFPGNSGGPVITKIEVTTLTGTPNVMKSNLIGVVASYVPYQDVAVSAQTGRPRIIFEENTGLAHVYPVDVIQETVEINIRDVVSKFEDNS